MIQQPYYIAIEPDHLMFDDIALLEKYEGKLDSILQKHHKLFSYQTDGWPIGLEIKLSQKIHSENAAFFEQNGKYLYADHDGHPPPFDKFENRVPSELGAHFAWAQNATGYDSASILRLGQILTNSKECQLRTRDIFTTPDIHGTRLKYLEYDSLSIEIDSFFQNQHRVYSSTYNLLICISKFIYFLAIHPLTDGNGRVSRILFQMWLRSAGLINMPLLPLGPIMHVRSHEFVMAFRCWIFEKNASFVFDFMIDCIEKTAVLTTSILSGDCKK
jgi:Fic/DOC family